MKPPPREAAAQHPLLVDAPHFRSVLQNQMLQQDSEEGRATYIYRDAESHLQKLFKMKDFYTKKLKDFTENRKCGTPLLSGSRYQHRSPKPRSGSSAAAFSNGFGSLSEAVHVIPQPQP